MAGDRKNVESNDILIDQGEPEVYVDIAGVEHSRPATKEPSRSTEEDALEPIENLPEELRPAPGE